MKHCGCALQTLVAELKAAKEGGMLTDEELATIRKTVDVGAKKGLSDVDPKSLHEVKGGWTGRPGRIHGWIWMDPDLDPWVWIHLGGGRCPSSISSAALRRWVPASGSRSNLGMDPLMVIGGIQ